MNKKDGRTKESKGQSQQQVHNDDDFFVGISTAEFEKMWPEIEALNKKELLASEYEMGLTGAMLEQLSTRLLKKK